MTVVVKMTTALMIKHAQPVNLLNLLKVGTLQMLMMNCADCKPMNSWIDTQRHTQATLSQSRNSVILC